MSDPAEGDVEKLKPIVRVLAGFIFLCSVLAVFGAVEEIFAAGIDLLVVAIFISAVVMLHVSASIALRGFAPKYLLFAHGSRKPRNGPSG